VRFYVSGSYQDEQGAIRGLKGAQHRRARVNVDYDIRPRLNVAISTLYDQGTLDLRNGGASGGTIFGRSSAAISLGTKHARPRHAGPPARAQRRGEPAQPDRQRRAATVLYDTENREQTRRVGPLLGSITRATRRPSGSTVEGTFAYDTRSRLDRGHRIKGYRTTAVALSDNKATCSSTTCSSGR
jgi:hypothetical protein